MPTLETPMLNRFSTYLLFACFFGPLSLMGQSFEEIGIPSGINFTYEALSDIGGGLAWFDYNNDGLQDLYLCGGQAEDRLYRNMGEGQFLDASSLADLFETSIRNTMGVVTGDIDNDGFRDIFVTTRNAGFSTTLQRNLLFYNNGDGSFTEIGIDANIAPIKWASSATFVDVNADGFLDIYMGNYIEDAALLYDAQGNTIGFAHTCYEDDLFLNNGDLTFSEADENYWPGNNGCTLAVQASDFDRDGNIDLLVNNDFGQWTTPNPLFSSNANGTGYENVAAGVGAELSIYGMGISAADYDRDMDMDYYFTNLGLNVLLRNDGEDGFVNATALAGAGNENFPEGLAVGWGTCFLDYNNSGFSDIFVANGFISAVSWLSNYFEQPNTLLRNNMDGTFTDVSLSELPTNLWRSRGAAVCDYDNDGHLDFGVHSVFSGLDTQPARFGLYHSTFGSGNYLSLNLEGVVCNRDAFGSQVEVYTPSGNHLVELTCGTSHLSQSSSTLHVGLAGETVIDSVLVYWPQGPVQQVEGLGINSLYQIVQDTTTVAPPDTTDTDPEDINWIISLPAGEGVVRIDNKKSTTWQAHQHTLERAVIFPQPAIQHLGIRLEAESTFATRFELLDASGRLVHVLWQGELHQGSQDLIFDRPTHLPGGLYFLRMTSGTQCVIHRITLAG